MRFFVFIVVAILSAGAARSDDTPSWAAFDVEQLQAQRSAKQRTYLEFLRTKTVRMGFYELAAGEDDRQSPHSLDEVYYVVAGRATLEVDGETSPVAAGSIVFVQAGVEHRFIEIKEDLSVVVFFSEAPPD